MTSSPVLASFAAELYDSLGPAASDPDEANDYAMAHLAAAIGAMWQPLADIVDPEDTPGWSAAVDPDRAPAAWLPWLGQLGGVRVPKGTPEQIARPLVKRVAGQRRGRPPTILDAAKSLLLEPKRAILRERHDVTTPGDAAYHVTLQVRASDVPPGGGGLLLALDLLLGPTVLLATPLDIEGAITRAFLASLPGGIIGHVVFTNNRTYDDAADEYADYTAVNAANTNYDDLLSP